MNPRLQLDFYEQILPFVLHLLTTFSGTLTGLNVLEMLNFMRKFLDTVTSEIPPFSEPLPFTP